MTNIFPAADDTRKLSRQNVSSSVAATFMYGNERTGKYILILESPNKGRSIPETEKNELKGKAEYERTNKNQESPYLSI